VYTLVNVVIVRSRGHVQTNVNRTTTYYPPWSYEWVLIRTIHWCYESYTSPHESYKPPRESYKPQRESYRSPYGLYDYHHIQTRNDGIPYSPPSGSYEPDAIRTITLTLYKPQHESYRCPYGLYDYHYIRTRHDKIPCPPPSGSYELNAIRTITSAFPRDPHPPLSQSLCDWGTLVRTREYSYDWKYTS